ncbi:sensor domain-containing protein [Vibrio mediterranei]|uniref:sensor domain-containing protein n=1 Tax=Vibrio mediterranei TaxID=689 RepID=UPI0007F36072|nr:bifunctional diguanylate cyclase/phosphodiesterase [Vibrio mediterranei]MCG9657301.1 EAL domain-containing protein [Vibrio mediterranei]SBO11145.1 Cyclic di-GMP phosphodiesterase Gmr [Vibrio mediterranei]
MSSKQIPTLQQFIDALDDHVWVKDADRKYIAVNKSVESAWNMPRSDIFGKTDFDLFAKSRSEHYQKADDRVIDSGVQETVEECASRDAYGHDVWLETIKSPIQQPDGELIGVIGMTRNVTRRKQVEVRLSITSEIFNNFQEGMMITDQNGKILDVNSAFSEVTGYQAIEVIGKNPRFLQSGHHDAQFYQNLWQQLSETGLWKGEFINRKKDGSIYPQMATISTINDDGNSLLHYICVFEDISKQKAHEEKLRKMAFFDPLTNLPNRSHLTSILEQSIEGGQRHSEQFATLFLDLDHFKHINDSKGHLYGDRLLSQVADRLADVLHHRASIGRIGGDEFVIILTDYDSEAQLLDTIDETLGVFNRPFELDSQESLRVSGSIGVALYPQDGQNSETLLKNADTAMYLAKKNGRNGYAFYSPDLTYSSVLHVRVQSALHDAVEKQQLSLVYQPQYDLTNNTLIGVEALLRWNHPELGVIAPAQFIPIAEKTGLIQRIGAWVIREACEQGRRWLDQGIEFGKIAVNVSGLQLQHPNFVTKLKQKLLDTNFPAERLEIEITESFLLIDHQLAVDTLNQIRELGIEISLDDFGTGYSSLSYLKGLPISKLKIDRSFICDVPDENDSNAIVQAIIVMGETLSLKIVAEGVENGDQVEYLRSHGCEYGQGYVFSKPVTADQLATLFV